MELDQLADVVVHAGTETREPIMPLALLLAEPAAGWRRCLDSEGFVGGFLLLP